MDSDTKGLLIFCGLIAATILGCVWINCHYGAMEHAEAIEAGYTQESVPTSHVIRWVKK
jgi:hypothetical protein